MVFQLRAPRPEDARHERTRQLPGRRPVLGRDPSARPARGAAVLRLPVRLADRRLRGGRLRGRAPARPRCRRHRRADRPRPPRGLVHERPRRQPRGRRARRAGRRGHGAARRHRRRAGRAARGDQRPAGRGPLPLGGGVSRGRPGDQRAGRVGDERTADGRRRRRARLLRQRLRLAGGGVRAGDAVAPARLHRRHADPARPPRRRRRGHPRRVRACALGRRLLGRRHGCHRRPRRRAGRQRHPGPVRPAPVPQRRARGRRGRRRSRSASWSRARRSGSARARRRPRSRPSR